MFTLRPGRLPAADVKNIIFFVRPKLELMDIIAENVARSVSQKQRPNWDQSVLWSVSADGMI